MIVGRNDTPPALIDQGWIEADPRRGAL